MARRAGFWAKTKGLLVIGSMPALTVFACEDSDGTGVEGAGGQAGQPDASGAAGEISEGLAGANAGGERQASGGSGISGDAGSGGNAAGGGGSEPNAGGGGAGSGGANASSGSGGEGGVPGEPGGGAGSQAGGAGGDFGAPTHPVFGCRDAHCESLRCSGNFVPTFQQALGEALDAGNLGPSYWHVVGIPEGFAVSLSDELYLFDLASRSFLPNPRPFDDVNDRIVPTDDGVFVIQSGRNIQKWASLTDASPLASRPLARFGYLLWSGSELILLSPDADTFRLELFDTDLEPLAAPITTEQVTGPDLPNDLSDTYNVKLNEAVAVSGRIALMVGGQYAERIWLISYDGSILDFDVPGHAIGEGDRLGFTDHGEFVYVGAYWDSPSFRLSSDGVVLARSALNLDTGIFANARNIGVVGPHLLFAISGRTSQSNGSEAAFLTFDEGRSHTPYHYGDIEEHRVAASGSAFASLYKTFYWQDPIGSFPFPKQPTFALYECED